MPWGQVMTQENLKRMLSVLILGSRDFETSDGRAKEVISVVAFWCVDYIVKSRMVIAGYSRIENK